MIGLIPVAYVLLTYDPRVGGMRQYFAFEIRLDIIAQWHVLGVA